MRKAADTTHDSARRALSQRSVLGSNRPKSPIDTQARQALGSPEKSRRGTVKSKPAPISPSDYGVEIGGRPSFGVLDRRIKRGLVVTGRKRLADGREQITYRICRRAAESSSIEEFSESTEID